MQRKRPRRTTTAATPTRSRGARAAPAPGPLGVLRHAGRPLRLEEITIALGPTAAAGAAAQLGELVRRGEVVLNRRGQYCLREQLPGLVVGTVQAQRSGDGQLLPDDASAPIHLPAHEMRVVMHGDRVAVRIEGERFRG